MSWNRASRACRGALVVVLVVAAATGCGTDSEKLTYLNTYFQEDNATICANVTTQGGVGVAAANAMLGIQNDRPDLGITLADVASYLGDRCRG